MRKAAKQIIVCALVLVLLCIACRLVFFNQFILYVLIPEGTEEEEIRVSLSRPDIVQAGEAEREGSWLKIPLEPIQPGEAELWLGEEMGSFHLLQVDRFHTVISRNNSNYTGDSAVLICVTLFWLLVSAIMLWHFFRAKGPAFYDYGTIYYAGFFLFALVSCLENLSATVSHITRPYEYSMMSAYATISSASRQFMMLTMPAMLVFAGAMAVSNIALLRHESPRKQNVLGLLVSSLLVIGELLGLILFTRDFVGSELESRIDITLQNTYATAFVYFQCMLTGSVICGIRAARHRPVPDKDFILINGCWFRKDGSLPPLLRGRADKALEFWHSQKEQTGREARFIPSGGQGNDEPMPEAEAIRQYLVSEGIEDRLILPETKSASTYENMAFSGEIIRNTDPAGKVVFATSSYHVFRSGLWARQAGLSAEGIGSRTKWWFWPNAFMRETAGLLLKRWKQEVLFLVLLIIFFGVLSMVLW